MRRLVALLGLATAALGAPAAPANPLPPADEARAYRLNAQHTNAQAGDWLAGPLTVRWRIAAKPNRPVLVTRDRVIYTTRFEANPEHLFVVDRMTGKLLWTRVLPEIGALGVGEGTVFLTRRTREGAGIYADLDSIDLETGLDRWTRRLPEAQYPDDPLVEDGLLYMGAGHLNAIETHDGHTRWWRYGSSGQPALVGDRVLGAGDICPNIHSFDRWLGTPRAAYFRYSCSGGISDPATISGEHFYVATYRFSLSAFEPVDAVAGVEAVAGGLRLRSAEYPRRLLAHDEATGDLRWRALGLRSPVVVGTTVAATSDTGEVVLLDLQTGEERWRGPLLPSHASLVAAQGSLIASDESGISLLGPPGPDTAILGRPADATASGTAVFAFSSDDSAAPFQCRLDGGAWASCTTPHTVDGLAPGLHAFEVRAGGDPTPALARWTVDTVAAPSRFESGPPPRTQSRYASFEFAIAEAARRIECRVDDGTWTRCVPPLKATVGEGSHTAQLRITDLAGNVESPAATWSWRVDGQPPVVTIAGGPPAHTTSTSATFTLEADEPASFECRLDGQHWQPCGASVTYHEFAHGSHTFQVRGTDSAGNGPGFIASHDWFVDRTPPALTKTAAPWPAAPAPAPAPARETLRLDAPERVRREGAARGVRLRVSGLRPGARLTVTATARGRLLARRTLRAAGPTVAVRLPLPRLRVTDRRVTYAVSAAGRRDERRVRLR